jgi:tetratricopeptide (TPR) repeat protein
MSIWGEIQGFLTENAVVLGSAAAVVAVAGAGWAVVARLVRRKPKLDLSEETIERIAPRATELNPKLTTAEFIRIRREMKADLEAEFASAHAKEKQQLAARIADLESELANPEAALAEALERVADLEQRLDRLGNDIGGDRLAEAHAALDRLDYSIADDIFAEIEARREMEVQQAAHAAFGRGEIAEAEVRWNDAADHYARAARLDPGYDALNKAQQLHWRAGRYAEAIRHAEQLVELARDQFAKVDAKTATALNNLATGYEATGRYDEADPLYREALEIRRKTLGTAHPAYATGLANLAGLLQATGRYDEAEPLYREALAVIEAALGADHPDTRTLRQNLEAFLDGRDG